MQADHENRLNALIDLAVLLGKQSDFQEILRLVTRNAMAIVQSDFAFMMMLNPRTHQTMKTIYTEGSAEHDPKIHFLHTNISGWVIKYKRSFLTPDIRTDDRFEADLLKDLKFQSAICVPLQMETGILGTLLIMNQPGSRIMNEADLEILNKLAGIVSPFMRDVQKIQQFFSAPLPRQTLLKKYEALGLLGACPAFVELLQAIESAARCDVRILLEGRSGTGKELIARAIHACSARSGHKFIAVDCGAIPENLMESELFGHVKGAFTGASISRKGLFEEADHGTLFMDEITNLPVDLQAKLLRVLQEGEIRPLGSNTTRKIDVRVITAASMPLKDLVREKQFREDLYYRLLVYPIDVPSLKERQADIPLLTGHFLKRFSKRQHKAVESVDDEVLNLILHRDWQGNIRQLENFIERLVTLTPADVNQISTVFLPREFRSELHSARRENQPDQTIGSLPETLAAFEKQLIRQALDQHGWNQSFAAAALAIPESTLRYKIQKYGIGK